MKDVPENCPITLSLFKRKPFAFLVLWSNFDITVIGGKPSDFIAFEIIQMECSAVVLQYQYLQFLYLAPCVAAIQIPSS